MLSLRQGPHAIPQVDVLILRILYWITDRLIRHLYGEDALVFCPDRDTHPTNVVDFYDYYHPTNDA